MDTAAPDPRRRRLAVAALACLAVLAGTGLAIRLTERPGPHPAGQGRPLSAAEARRLAVMRVTNHRDGRAGLTATLGGPGSTSRLTGSVDWSRSLVYLTVSGTTGAVPDGLLQAVPGVVATRSARPAGAPVGPAVSDRPGPPPLPPPDGWRIRRLAVASPTPLDSLVSLLFRMAADRPDPVRTEGPQAARWVAHGDDGGVDVVLAPAPAATGPAASGGDTSGAQVRYWLDDNARLHRVEALLAGGVPAVVNFDRTSRPEIVAIDALGGPPVHPRAVTNAEADRLSGMRPAGRASGGATVTLTVPTMPAADVRGAGWVDWRRGVAYLRLTGLDRPDGVSLMRADDRAVAIRPMTDRAARPGPTVARSTTPAVSCPPPLPPPRGTGWVVTPWRHRGDELGAFDLDLLVGEALAAGRPGHDDPGELRASAVWLRADTVGGRRVSVFEMPKPAEADEPPGRARLRYWVDRTGLLRRLELRTRTGAFAHLDLRPGPVPRQVADPVD